MTYPVCPCDAETIVAPTNLPELSYISYRAGDYVSFRQALLTPLFTPATPEPLPVEQTLSVDGISVWRTDEVGDLAVMIAEWFAYVADVITFYNERIANQDYLRTADLTDSVNNLIQLLGYRPRPAIGAYGALAALMTPGPSFGGQGVILPAGLQFQSKPLPGLAPQTFELSADTLIVAPDQLPAVPPPFLLSQVSTSIWHYSPYHAHFDPVWEWGLGPVVSIDAGESKLLLQGAVKTIDPGALLRLRMRDGSSGPWLATVVSAEIDPAPSGGGQQTSLALTLSGAPPTGVTAAQAALESASQSAAVWSFFSGAIDGATVHLASLERQIQSGDWLLFTAESGSPAPVLTQVASTADVIWDANGSSASSPTIPPSTTTTVTNSGTVTVTSTPSPIPVLHTQLTLTSDLPVGWDSAGGVTVRFAWVTAGTLLDQPFAAWSGSPTTLTGVGPTPLPSWSSQAILLQDSTGLGISAVAGSAGGFSVTVGGLPDPTPSLEPPFLVLPNLLPVTRGKTVANEVLGNGDATNPAQDFQLSQSPVTYLQQGAAYASTIALTVNGLPWTEVASFYGQSSTATVFVSREDNSGATHVMFGDGVNGARLPTGVNNVIATYRVGAGAASPPAGKLTVIAKPYPGLRSVLNPVAVIGGADPDPPDQIRRYAPRSVLTFGRAVSVFDYEALAAQTPGVTRASAVWAWNDARQRALVTVYVGDTPGAQAAANSALLAAGDPNRPVVVVEAADVAAALTLTLLVTPGMDQTLIAQAVAAALTDTEAGLFGSWTMGVGQTVFDSQIEAAVLSVSGAVAITLLSFDADGAADAGPLHDPGEGGYFTLDPADINLTMEADPNG